MDQTALIELIETRFREADPANLRYVTRELERLVRQIEDPRTRARYEGALDGLAEMVDHLDTGRGA